MRQRAAVIGTVVAVITLGLLSAVAVVPAQAKLAKTVDVKAKTTARTTFGRGDAGGDYTGKISFPKVKPAIRGDRVPKKMADAARDACYRLYAGGPNKRGTPYVRLIQRPKTFGGLRLNDASETKFTRKGRWRTWGADGSDNEPFVGNKIEVQGGIWDEFRNNRLNFAPKKFRFRGKKRTAHCRPFTAVIEPT